MNFNRCDPSPRRLARPGHRWRPGGRRWGKPGCLVLAFSGHPPTSVSATPVGL